MTGARPATLLIAATLALAGCAGTGAPAPAGDLAPDAQMRALAAVFRDAGLEAGFFDAHSVVLSREGLDVLVFREDDGSSLQAVLACTRQGRGDAGRVLAWNAGRRFGRAYLDDDGRPVLASDLALDPPVSTSVVAAWGRMVLDMAVLFVAEVWPEPAASGGP
jgi:hypothetical protein